MEYQLIGEEFSARSTFSDAVKGTPEVKGINGAITTSQLESFVALTQW
jgi:hypothetical protein